ACDPNLAIENVATHCFQLRAYTVRERSTINQLHARLSRANHALYRRHSMADAHIHRGESMIVSRTLSCSQRTRSARRIVFRLQGPGPRPWARLARSTPIA